MHLSSNDLQELEKIKRLNIVNSISGIKPGNLIGTISNTQQTNLAIFSSIVHLGSNPPLLGFVLRPQDFVKRDTYENILENGVYTINHIHADIAEQAHYSSAKFDKDVSEFEACHLTEEFLFDFKAPFVKESKIKIALEHLESMPIKANNTILVIGEIKHIVIPDEIMDSAGHLNLEASQNVGISGLNSYYRLEQFAQFPYARPSNVPNFKDEQ